MNTTARQIGMILLAGMILAVVANMVHPRRIPWRQDWSGQVEEMAVQREIPLVPFAAAAELSAGKEAVFIDARPAEEFEKGRIPDALSVPLATWEDTFLTLSGYIEARVPLVVYCSGRTCDDALLLAVELKSMGAAVSLFIDGFDSWEEHGGAVER